MITQPDFSGITVIYGRQGTGKTTWARQQAKGPGHHTAYARLTNCGWPDWNHFNTYPPAATTLIIDDVPADKILDFVVNLTLKPGNHIYLLTQSRPTFLPDTVDCVAIELLTND